MDDDRQEGQNAKRQGKETEEEEGWEAAVKGYHSPMS